VRITGWLRNLDPAWRRALTAFLAIRILLLAVAVLVVALYPGSLDPQASFRQRIGIPAVEGPVPNALWGVWLRWDTLWYIRYARDGLLPADHPEYRAFWPLYPWLMRWVAPLLGGSHLAAGLLISNAALVVALVLFYRLVEMESDVHAARRGTWYLLLFPSAFFLYAAYSESSFLVFSLGAFYAARRSRWLRAGLWVAGAALLRIPGAFLIPALGFEYLRQRTGTRGWSAWRSAEWWRGTLLQGWPFLIMLAGAAFMPAYTALFLKGEGVGATIDFHVRTAVAGEGWVFPWEALAEAVRSLTTGRFFFIQPFDLAATLLMLYLTVMAFCRLPLTYAIYMAITMLALLSRSIPQQPLISALRYVLGLFPAFMLLGEVGRTPWRNRLITYPSLLLFGFMAAEFMIGGYVG
jgi:hypothetical protein